MLMYSLLCYDMQSTLATYYQTQNTLPHERLCWKRFLLWSQQPWILHNKIRSQLAFSPLLSLKRFSGFKTFFLFFSLFFSVCLSPGPIKISKLRLITIPTALHLEFFHKLAALNYTPTLWAWKSCLQGSWPSGGHTLNTCAQKFPA